MVNSRPGSRVKNTNGLCSLWSGSSIGTKAPGTAPSRANRLGHAIAVSGGGGPFGRPARRGAQILPRPRRDLPELLGGVKRPIGVAQHLAREQHEVGLI